MSQQLTGLLDVEDPISGHYDLEVSSPGLDRPLFTLEQCKRFIGETVKLKLHKKLDGRKNFIGTLNAVNGDEVVINCEDEEYKVLFSLVERARLVPRF